VNAPCEQHPANPANRAPRQVEGCLKHSQSASNGKCAAHGGGWRCKAEGCTKFAQVSVGGVKSGWGQKYVMRCKWACRQGL